MGLQVQAKICPICHDDHWPNQLCKFHDLRDRIAALESQLAESERTIAELRHRGTRIGEKELAAENDRLRAENAELREALEDSETARSNLFSGWQGMRKERDDAIRDAEACQSHCEDVTTQLMTLEAVTAERDEAKRVAVWAAKLGCELQLSYLQSGVDLVIGSGLSRRRFPVNDNDDADIYRALKQAMGE